MSDKVNWKCFRKLIIYFLLALIIDKQLLYYLYSDNDGPEEWLLGNRATMNIIMEQFLEA